MTVKLNLTIEESVAKRIKSYAQRKKTSVSKIVEKQLDEVLRTEKKTILSGNLLINTQVL